MTTDRAVILRSLLEPEAFGTLFQRHAGPIHRFVARRTSDSIADDVVAETFLRAFERRDRFSRSYEDALPWLFGIAVNVLRRRRRDELRFLPEDLERADPTDGVDAVSRRVDAERQLREVVTTVRRMPAGMRDVLLLHVWADLSTEDVAHALGIPVGTVHSRLSRARAALRTSPLPARPIGDPHGHDAAAARLP